MTLFPPLRILVFSGSKYIVGFNVTLAAVVGAGAVSVVGAGIGAAILYKYWKGKQGGDGAGAL